MKLYSYWRSTAAYRVRIALHLKGVEYETITLNLQKGEHREPGFVAKNPHRTVPVIDDDGVVLAQSLAIVEYLDARFPEPRLIPAEPVKRARVQAFAQIVACEIHPLNNLRVLRYLRGELGVDEERVNGWVRHWIGESFRSLEALLAESAGAYCFGDELTLADVYLAPQMFNARRFGCDLAPFPRIVRVDAALRALPAFARAAPELQPDAER
jgi:maleylacetoacetate isomerase/maleylpyruvate isomerase